MRPRSLSEIARTVDGSLHGDDTVASSVVIDSRLSSYLKRYRSDSGILVARPLK